MQEAMKTLGPQIIQMMAPFDNVSESAEVKTQKKSAADAICDLLVTNGMAFYEQVDNRHVLVHPQNRDGVGLEGSDVHDLIDFIVSAGFSMGETAGARCIQVNPNNSDQLIFNDTLVEKSAGMLAPVVREDARVLSVTCSTTTAGLRAVAAGCKTHVERLASGGFLSKEK
eukprot:5797838-Pyramimonas_sp.AAC.1